MILEKNKNVGSVSILQIIIYLTIVSVIAFFNCACLKAANPDDDIKLEKWMLEISTHNITEQEISVEEWMTSNTEFMAESELEIEQWMISSDNDIMAQTEIVIEDWMIDDIKQGSSLSHINTTEKLELEDWMVDINSANYYLLYCM